jgi:glycosyltransferase involved in cell wall biosynthesis
LGPARKKPRFDAVFYAPWASNLVVPGTAAEAAAGGAETQLFLIAKGLARRDLRIAMIVTGAGDDLPASVAGVTILPQRPRGRLRGHTARVALAAEAFRTVVRARGAVVIQRNAGPTTAVAALAARATGAAFVYSSANVVDFDLARIERASNVRLFEWGVRLAAEVVVQTDEQAVLCRSRFGREPLVIRSIAERAAPSDAAPEAFLWIGRMAPYKRLDVYLDLAAAVPEARFRVIAVPGSDPPPEVVARLARARDELPNLEVLHPRPRGELGPVFNRAVAVVNTSEFEGMPNVFLEGWSRGVPALAFSHDPDGVVAKHGLGGFAAGSSERLVELAREQWTSRQDRRDVAARCIDYIRLHHDVEAVTERWLSHVLPATVSRQSSHTASTS